MEVFRRVDVQFSRGSNGRTVLLLLFSFQYFPQQRESVLILHRDRQRSIISLRSRRFRCLLPCKGKTGASLWRVVEAQNSVGLSRTVPRSAARVQTFPPLPCLLLHLPSVAALHQRALPWHAGEQRPQSGRLMALVMPRPWRHVSQR